MPASGDQHKASGNGANNPFEDQKTAPSAYTAVEIATLQSRLDKQLGPEYISSRPGAAGQKVHYLAAEKVINLANEVFGFNGWSSAVQNIQIDFVDENAQTGKISLGLSVIVRVTLKDGTFHEDVGYGHIENCKGKAAAFEKCKKEGTTDALKRALRTFGNVLGNCIYDKEFVAKVTKVKVGAGRWDVNELHRHPDFVPKKQVEAVRKIEDVGDDKALTSISTNLTVSSDEDLGDGFDIADFDDTDFAMTETDHPDEVTLPAESGSLRQGESREMKPPVRNGATTPSRPPQIRYAPTPASANTALTRPPRFPGQGSAATPQRLQAPPHLQQQAAQDRTNPNLAVLQEQQPGHPGAHYSPSPGVALQHFAPLPQQIPGQTNAPSQLPSVGFYSARAAGSGDLGNSNPAAAPRFNPHAESPSIRKTPGVDHTKSVPVKHEVIAKQLGGQNRDFIDPRSTGRQVGGPGQAAQSPMSKVPGGGGMTTSAYRPPTRRGNEVTPITHASAGVPGGVDRVMSGVKRTPLTDVSNVQLQHNVTAATVDGGDAKRQRLSGPEVAGIGVENNAAGDGMGICEPAV